MKNLSRREFMRMAGQMLAGLGIIGFSIWDLPPGTDIEGRPLVKWGEPCSPYFCYKHYDDALDTSPNFVGVAQVIVNDTPYYTPVYGIPNDG